MPPVQTPSSSDVRLVNEPSLSVIGLAAKTNNEDETPSSRSRLGQLWRNFMAESDNRIPGTPDRSVIYCVYTEYESDENGPYKAILGRAVTGKIEVPHELERIDIDGAQYLVFRALDRNPESVRDAWSRVHQYFRENPDRQRAFTADFDRYGPSGVDLYAAVR